jgi:Na+/H+ antiporter NhaD/arsenite permease-like protein
MIILRCLVVAIAYMGIGLGYLPGLRMNRASIAISGAALLMALGVLDLQTAWSAIDYQTLTFLFGMMIINASLEAAGFFQLAIDYLIRYVHSPFGLIVTITVGSGVLSALFLSLTRSLDLKPIPYLLALAGATNCGSVATLSGNPQNILIGSFSGISYLDFATALLPIAGISLTIQIALLYILYPEVRSFESCLNAVPQPYRLFKPLLIKSSIVTVGLLIAFLIGVPTAAATLIAAASLLVTRRVDSDRFLHKVDWNLLVMFCGLFILTEGVQKLGLLNGLSAFVDAPLRISIVTTLLSNLVSNVPAILLLHHLIPHPDRQTWLLLAAASTLAGNLTLLGSVANLIVAEAVKKSGAALTFWEHFRFGLPLTIATLTLTYVWLY